MIPLDKQSCLFDTYIKIGMGLCYARVAPIINNKKRRNYANYCTIGKKRKKDYSRKD